MTIFDSIGSIFDSGLELVEGIPGDVKDIVGDVKGLAHGVTQGVEGIGSTLKNLPLILGGVGVIAILFYMK